MNQSSQIEILASGTSDGGDKSWDMRGRVSAPVNKPVHEYLTNKGFEHKGNHTHGFGGTQSIYRHPETNVAVYITKGHTVPGVKRLVKGFSK